MRTQIRKKICTCEIHSFKWKVVKQLLSEQVLKNYGRSSKLLLAEKDIPDLHFDVMNVKEKKKTSEGTDVMEIVNVATKESAQNSDS